MYPNHHQANCKLVFFFLSPAFFFNFSLLCSMRAFFLYLGRQFTSSYQVHFAGLSNFHMYTIKNKILKFHEKQKHWKIVGEKNQKVVKKLTRSLKASLHRCTVRFKLIESREDLVVALSWNLFLSDRRHTNERIGAFFAPQLWREMPIDVPVRMRGNERVDD